MALAHDICRCESESCDRRTACARYVDRFDAGPRTLFAEHKCWADYDAYIPIETVTEREAVTSPARKGGAFSSKGNSGLHA